MAYDHVGINFGNALQDIGLEMFREKRANAAYERERKQRSADDEAARKREMGDKARAARAEQYKRTVEGPDGELMEQVYEGKLQPDGSFSEKPIGKPRPIAAAEYKDVERKVGDSIKTFRTYADGTEKEIASAPRYRPNSGGAPREPKSQLFEVNGKLVRIGENEPIPEGARLPSRGGEGAGADGMTPAQAASVIQTYRKNPRQIQGSDGDWKDQTLRESMAEDGLDYDAIVAKANGRKPVMAQDGPVKSAAKTASSTLSAIGSGLSAMASRPLMARDEAPRGAAKPSAPSAGPKASQSPYPDGTRLQGPDGRMYVVRNGEPVPE